jgi:hypothetical protein
MEGEGTQPSYVDAFPQLTLDVFFFGLSHLEVNILGLEQSN